MANPTTNFGWVMPTSTDLVTDLPADFNVFGQGVDTTMADLKGGTTGQILSKATNTDMDFVWIANDQGDITGVTATSPLTGGGTSGAITVGIQDATTSVKGAVQLSDSTSTTSSVLASTPTATKSAYDLANTANTTAAAAIPKSTVTTAGDVIYATGSGAVTRLGIGTAGQVLTVNGGGTAPSWAAAASGAQGLTLITKQTFSAATSVNVNNCFSATYENYKVIITITSASGSAPCTLRLRVGGADNSTSNYGSSYAESNSGGVANRYSNAADGWIKSNINITTNFIWTFDINQPFLTQRTAFAGVYGQEDSGARTGAPAGYFNATTSFDGFSIILASNNITGFVSIYGYKI